MVRKAAVSVLVVFAFHVVLAAPAVLPFSPLNPFMPLIRRMPSAVPAVLPANLSFRNSVKKIVPAVFAVSAVQPFSPNAALSNTSLSRGRYGAVFP